MLDRITHFLARTERPSKPIPRLSPAAGALVGALALLALLLIMS